ncbi:MAG: hypothetical protein K6U89_06150, partial [Chloroflexi bacterium]|nr:hypothetical protein [Chloroflexota bacterium]
VSFSTSNDGWAVGDSGTIFRWNGSAWNVQSSGTTVTLRAVVARNNNFALAVGDSGTILRWDGSTLRNVIRGDTPNFLSLSLVPSSTSNGWAGADNGAVYQWNGSGFSAALPIAGGVPPGGVRIRGISILSDSQGWAVTADGDNRIYQWTGGNTWNSQSDAPKGLNAVFVFDANNGWAVGEGGTLVRYSNGSWRLHQPSSPTSQQLNGIWMWSQTDGWAVGDEGVILRLQGGTWNRVDSTTNKNLYAVYALSATEAWAVGDSVIMRYSAQ